MSRWQIYEVTTDADGVDCYIKRGELVRCKECKWNDGKGHCKLRYGSLGVFEDVSCDDYCSYGERKESE